MTNYSENPIENEAQPDKENLSTTKREMKTSFVLMEQPKEIPQNPQSQSLIEKYLEKIIVELSEVEDLKNMVDEVVNAAKNGEEKFKDEFLKYFSEFQQRSEDLIVKLDDEVNIKENLRNRIEKNKAEQEALLLKRELEEERVRITSLCNEINKFITDQIQQNTDSLNNFCSEIQAKIDDKIQDVKSSTNIILGKIKEDSESTNYEIKEKMQSMSVTYDQVNKQFSDMFENFKTSEEIAETKIGEKLEEFKQNSNSVMIHEITNIKKTMESTLNEFKVAYVNTTGELKEKCICFLQECDLANKQILERIPKTSFSQKREIRKDRFIYALCSISIITFILQLFV